MTADPGKHEKAGVVSQKINVLALCLQIPADIAVSAPDVPWSRRPGKACKGPSVSEGQVFEVFSNGSCVAQVVELCEQSVMKRLKSSASDLVNGYGGEGSNVGADRSLIYCDELGSHRMGATCSASPRRQLDVSFGLKAQQKPATNGILGVSIGLCPVPELADFTR